MIEQKRFPKTFFETFKNLILYKIPDFFRKDEHDYDESARKLLSPPKQQNKHHIAQHAEVLEFKSKLLQNQANFLGNELNELTAKKSMTNVDKANTEYKYNNAIGGKLRYVESEPRKDITSVMLQYCHEFYKFGNKVFNVEEQLMEELLLTDVSKVDDSFLVLPYPAMLLQIPFNNALKVNNGVIKSIFISEKTEDNRKLINCLYVGEDKNISFASKFEFTGGDILKQVQTQVTAKFENSSLAYKESKKIFSFIISVLLYMNSKDADKEEIKPRVLFQKQDSVIPVCVLGGRIIINRQLHQSQLSESTNHHIIHILKWTVRGHFRNQPIGEGRHERKLIWIRPFLKGAERLDEKMPIRQKEYVVK